MSLFFYDRQVRRFLQQVIAVFSNFSVEFGREEDGTRTLYRVPVRYGDPTRMASAILKDNSENKLSSVPVMTVYITSLEWDRERMQDPTFVSKINVRERRVNETDGALTIQQGNAVTVERLMPVAYELNVNVDIWTSNTEQKLQILEQILPLFNPDLEIQSTDNFIDWTSLSYIHLDNVIWSSRSIPVGVDDQIDVATLSFYIPIWLSAPAKVKKLGVIQTIINSIYDAGGDLSADVIQAVNLLRNRQYITPLGYNLLLLNGQATLLPSNYPLTRGTGSTAVPENPNDPINWQPLINTFGSLTNGISQLRLKKDNPDVVSEVIGTVAQHPTDPSVLLFTVDQDTIPQNSMPPVNAIIDPLRTTPGDGLSAAAIGQRYLILNDLSGDQSAWSGIAANSNDIISYNGTSWQVSWSSAGITKIEYVTNLNTGIQYKWTGTQWQKSYEGEYPAGQWSLVL